MIRMIPQTSRKFKSTPIRARSARGPLRGTSLRIQWSFVRMYLCGEAKWVVVRGRIDRMLADVFGVGRCEVGKDPCMQAGRHFDYRSRLDKENC
jgi:hypothetical protein